MQQSFKEDWIQFIHELQSRICSELEKLDEKAVLIKDDWTRPEGGGGRTRVFQHGNVLEKGGVNTSVVFGSVTNTMRTQLKMDGDKWFAAGISLVLHPSNPFAPTVHANYRMFELYDGKGGLIDRWFGGGTDLTPYYLEEKDAVHFHSTYKKICDNADPSFYGKFKKDCDDYFVNTHRNNERRGIGGIFFDYQREDETRLSSFWLDFAKGCGYGFLDAYLPILIRRKDLPFTEDQKYWQEIRRGRYVEFNLVHDRGTLFGLKTNGRIESILMSLPPTVRFEYDFKPEEGTEEDKLLRVCLNPRDWV